MTNELAPQDWLPLAVRMEQEGKEALGLACGHLCVQGSELIATLAKRVNTQSSELVALRRRVAELEKPVETKDQREKRFMDHGLCWCGCKPGYCPH